MVKTAVRSGTIRVAPYRVTLWLYRRLCGAKVRAMQIVERIRSVRKESEAWLSVCPDKKDLKIFCDMLREGDSTRPDLLRNSGGAQQIACAGGHKLAKCTGTLALICKGKGACAAGTVRPAHRRKLSQAEELKNLRIAEAQHDCSCAASLSMPEQRRRVPTCWRGPTRKRHSATRRTWDGQRMPQNEHQAHLWAGVCWIYEGKSQTKSQGSESKPP